MAMPDFTDAPVLVTGGGGFIGSNLVDDLLARGARVRVLDNFATGRRENLAHCADGIELLEGDIRDGATCEASCRDQRFVFHQAALGSVPRSMEDPATTLDVNTQGTANMLAAARNAGVERFVFASSSSVYGDSPRLPKKEGEEGAPLSPYATSKSFCEELADTFSRCYGLMWVGLRYFNVYGPRQDPAGPYAAVIPRFFDALLDDERPLIYGDGEQSRDFTYVADAARANLLAAGAGDEACNRAYNVAAGDRTSVNELAELVRQAVGSSATPT
ncbi:MAG: NAD-dependent epimerase/dehydratase family protein, partial [Thermoanaerobaculia bacterium]